MHACPEDPFGVYLLKQQKQSGCARNARSDNEHMSLLIDDKLLP